MERDYFDRDDPWSEEPIVNPTEEQVAEQEAFDAMSARFEADGSEPTTVKLVDPEDAPIEMIMSDGGTAMRIQHAWAVGLEHVMNAQPITNADIFLALRNTFLSFANSVVREKIETNPIGAYINKISTVAMLNGIIAEIDTWGVPTPPEHKRN